MYCRDRSREYVKLRLILRLAFPDRKNPPSKRLQFFDNQHIPSLVGRELCLPEVRASGRRCRIWAPGMLVPKTAMHKYCYLAARQDEVRATRQRSVMEAKPQPRGMQIPPHPHFGLGVATLDGTHHLGSNLRRDRVSQVQLLLSLFVARQAKVIIRPGTIPAKTPAKPILASFRSDDR